MQTIIIRLHDFSIVFNREVLIFRHTWNDDTVNDLYTALSAYRIDAY